MTFREFIGSNLRNLYIEEKHVYAYVRKSKRYIEGQFIDCIDIANITVNEDFQNRGYCTKFLTYVISNYWENIYVECIQNPAMEHICEKLEFTRIEGISDLNMYKLKQ